MQTETVLRNIKMSNYLLIITIIALFSTIHQYVSGNPLGEKGNYTDTQLNSVADRVKKLEQMQINLDRIKTVDTECRVQAHDKLANVVNRMYYKSKQCRLLQGTLDNMTGLVIDIEHFFEGLLGLAVEIFLFVHCMFNSCSQVQQLSVLYGFPAALVYILKLPFDVVAFPFRTVELIWDCLSVDAIVTSVQTVAEEALQCNLTHSTNLATY